MLVTFTSDASGEAPGWLLSYEAEIPVYCAGMVNMNDQSATFSDGSGPADYHNGSTCMWMIQPPGASELTLYFNSFNTEEEFDQLKVFDPVTQDLLADLSGDIIPPPVTSPSGKAFITFSTNYTVTAPGWEIYYETDLVKLEENLIEKSFNMYPNPARDKVTLTFLADNDSHLKVSITDMAGQEVYDKTSSASTGENSLEINTNMMESGVYILKITSEDFALYKKLILK